MTTDVAFKRHSATAHAAYHDLLNSLLDESLSDIRGTPTAVVRNGRTYWYDTFRVGTDVKRRYIGEDTPAIRSRIDSVREGRSDREDQRRNRARLVRLLRAERMLGTDGATAGLLAAFANAGVFRLGGTVVGTHAFRLYEGELGIRFTFDQTAMTSDIDIASFEQLSVALDERTEPAVPELLAGFDFEPVPTLDRTAVWRWRQTRNDALVEFLTPSFEEEEGTKSLPSLGVKVRALHHLNFLIAEPIPAAVLYRSGVLVQIPRPERYAIHKLIVADRRREGPDSLKAVKDRMQAELLIEVLAEDRPEDLAEAYQTALSSGPNWRLHLERSLKRMPSTLDRLTAL